MMNEEQNISIMQKYAEDKSLAVYLYYYIIDLIKVCFLTITYPFREVVNYMVYTHDKLQNKRAENYYNRHAFD